jgi:pimeloyl-ACP methyl ester carboxylesterase
MADGERELIEEPVGFGPERALVGIVSAPSRDAGSSVGVILLNAGLVHRVGPNRSHVALARRLAAGGCTTLRFDFSGIGDSPPRQDAVPFETFAITETADAMRRLESSRGIERFVLFGLCSGADVALQAAYRDERVVGAVLVNPSVYRDLSRAAVSHARAAGGDAEHATVRARMRYYRSRLLSLPHWKRALTGRSNWGAIVRTLAGMARGSGSSRNEHVEAAVADLGRLTERGVRTLLVYSEGSTAWDLFRPGMERGLRALAGRGMTIETLRHTDHVFTLLWSQEALIERVTEWVSGEFGTRPGTA